MNAGQWEALCDGCGRCCLHKLEVKDTCVFTCVACRLLDIEACQCKQYEQRQKLVPGCLVLKASMSAQQYAWLPDSCAYKRLAKGQGLASWHPLVSGSRETVRQADMSVSELAIPEREALRFDTLESYKTHLRSAPD